MTEFIGVAVLAYESVHDIMNAVRSIKFHTKPPIRLFVFDNSEYTTGLRDYCTRAHPDVVYLSAGHNAGCTVSRNRIFHEFLRRHPKAEYLVVADQDVIVRPGWLAAMVKVASEHPDAGVVAWPVANRYRPVTREGIVSEVASVCNLHRIASLVEIEKRWGGPWDERFFMHKFDSLLCQRLNQLGWRTYLALDGYDPARPWPAQCGLITHNHPHRGVHRNPHWRAIFQRSKAIYRGIMAAEGWDEWRPPGPYLPYYGPDRGP